MALPTTLGTKGDRTRQRILELAVQRFAADGYRRTSVSDIARDADLTPAAVYAYFANKEALFQAAVDADASALIEQSRVIVGGHPAREGVGVMLTTVATLLAEHPLAARVLAGHEPDVIDRLLELPSLHEFTADLAEDIRAAQLEGEIRADIAPAVIAQGLETIVLSLLMGALQAGLDAASTRAVSAREFLDAVLRPPT